MLFAFSYFQSTILPEFPKSPAIIFLIAGSIAGQFRDYWASHLRRLHALSNYHQKRLAQFSSSFHLLELSHAQLERQLAGTTISLRTSLQRLKQQLQTREVNRECPLGGIGAWLLDFLAEVGNLHVAAIYAIDEHGKLAAAPVSVLGEAKELPPTHPLLLEALSTGAVTSIHAHDLDSGTVIAIVPLVDSHRHVHGIVSINAMPFIAIHQRTFDVLGIIARQMGDILTSHNPAQPGALPKETLQGSLQRALQIAQHDGLPVAVIACKIVEPIKSEHIIKLCLEVIRGVDQSWLWHDRLGHPLIINILPMADEAAAQSQIQRLRQRIIEQCGRVTAADFQSNVWAVKPNQDVDALLEIICSTCDIQAAESLDDFPQSIQDIAS